MTAEEVAADIRSMVVELNDAVKTAGEEHGVSVKMSTGTESDGKGHVTDQLAVHLFQRRTL